jgi:hypothetical protein
MIYILRGRVPIHHRSSNRTKVPGWGWAADPVSRGKVKIREIREYQLDIGPSDCLVLFMLVFSCLGRERKLTVEMGRWLPIENPRSGIQMPMVSRGELTLMLAPCRGWVPNLLLVWVLGVLKTGEDVKDASWNLFDR